MDNPVDFNISFILFYFILFVAAAAAAAAQTGIRTKLMNSSIVVNELPIPFPWENGRLFNELRNKGDDRYSNLSPTVTKTNLFGT